MHRYLLAVVVMILPMSASVAADKPFTPMIYSQDLKDICISDKPGFDLACEIFIQGVIETWIYRDAVSADPPKFAARKLPFCEVIWHTSKEDWKRIVRAALPSAQEQWPGAYVVMKSLHDELCKDVPGVSPSGQWFDGTNRSTQ